MRRDARRLIERWSEQARNADAEVRWKSAELRGRPRPPKVTRERLTAWVERERKLAVSYRRAIQRAERILRGEPAFGGVPSRGRVMTAAEATRWLEENHVTFSEELAQRCRAAIAETKARREHQGPEHFAVECARCHHDRGWHHDSGVKPLACTHPRCFDECERFVEPLPVCQCPKLCFDVLRYGDCEDCGKPYPSEVRG